MSEENDVASRLRALEAVVARQAARIDEQEAVIASLRGAGGLADPRKLGEGSEGLGRRQLLGGLGRVAAGAAVGGAAVVVGTASPAAAAAGSFDSSVTATPGVEGKHFQGGAALQGVSSTDVGGAGQGAGVVGTASGTSNKLAMPLTEPTGVGGLGRTGVLGRGASFNSQSVGVRGESDGTAGTGGVFSGARADMRLAGTTAGPSRNHSAGHLVGELAMDSATGELWICVGAGSAGQAGTWKRVAYQEGTAPIGPMQATTGVGSKPGAEVLASTAEPGLEAGSATSDLPAVRATSTGSSSAVQALHTGGGSAISASTSGGTGGVGAIVASNTSPTGRALIATTSANGSVGVSAEAGGSNSTALLGNAPGTNGFGVFGIGPTGVAGTGSNGVAGAIGVQGASRDGLGAAFTGAVANVRLTAGAPGPTRSHAVGHAVGELAMDTGGTLWVCVGAGLPGQVGTWKRVSYVEDLPPAFDPGTIPAPTGLFTALPKPGRVYDSRSVDGKLVSGRSRNISVANTTTGDEIVPAGSSGVVFTLTLDQTEGAGFLSVFPSTVGFPGTSSINWFANGQIIANGGTVTVPADRTVTVLAGGGGATHFLLDITGVFT